MERSRAMLAALSVVFAARQIPYRGNPRYLFRVMQAAPNEPAARLRAAIGDASRGLVDREVLVEAVVLAAVANEHVLVIGPPGTAKSEAVRRVARALGGKYFEYLLGRFTEPSEIFGPVDLQKLKAGVVETRTTGMLPEAEIAFLDEVFRGSTAILNTLLGILNERRFRRGHTAMDCPLRVCVGASNGLPEDDALMAFSDRFLVQLYLDPVLDPQLEDLLAGGWALESGVSSTSDIATLDEVARAARRVDMHPVRPLLADGIRTLRKAGISLSDRRCVRVQRVVAAAAALAGRQVATAADLWPLVLAVPSAEAQSAARDVLRELLAQSHNDTLPAAAETTSLGPLARASRIVERARSVLDERPDPSASSSSWSLKLEGIAREIDAGFSADRLPPELAEVRQRLVAAMDEGA
jgi:MoxR-like ATPase